MAKKKRKKNGKGGLKAAAQFLGAVSSLFLKVLPSLVIILASGAIFMNVRQALYADANLAIQKISVQPSDALTAAQRNQLESRFMGKNILQVNIRKVSSDLEKDPGIQSARVLKQLPATLDITVERRKAIACLRYAAHGNCGLISDDGVILDIIAEKNIPGVLIEALESQNREPSLGQKVELRGFGEAVNFMKAFQEQELSHYEPLSKINLDHIGNVSITLGAGPQIRLGRRPLETLKSLEKVVPLLKSDDRGKIEYIDLQFDNVIVKKKPAKN